MKKYTFFFLLLTILTVQNAFAQRNETKANDSNTPLHLLQPDYPVPYGKVEIADVTQVLNRIHGYLNAVTPTGFVNSKTGEKLNDLSKIDSNTVLAKGDFRLVSYEWGVTYGAMLLATEATGDDRYKKYADERLQFLADAAPYFRKSVAAHEGWGSKTPLRNLTVGQS